MHGAPVKQCHHVGYKGGGRVGGTGEDLFLDQSDHLDVELFVCHSLFVCQIHWGSTETVLINLAKGCFVLGSFMR